MTHRVRLIDAGTGEVLAEGMRPRDQPALDRDVLVAESVIHQALDESGLGEMLDRPHRLPAEAWVEEGARVETDL